MNILGLENVQSRPNIIEVRITAMNTEIVQLPRKYEKVERDDSAGTGAHSRA